MLTDSVALQLLQRQYGFDAGATVFSDLIKGIAKCASVEDTMIEHRGISGDWYFDLNLYEFWKQQAAWSEATFGTTAERGPLGPLKHLVKEVQEVIKDPTDIVEFADCLFLIFDSARRAGFTYEQFVEAAWKELEINKARKWQPIVSGDEPVEHDRTGE